MSETVAEETTCDEDVTDSDDDDDEGSFDLMYSVRWCCNVVRVPADMESPGFNFGQGKSGNFVDGHGRMISVGLQLRWVG